MGVIMVWSYFLRDIMCYDGHSLEANLQEYA